MNRLVTVGVLLVLSGAQAQIEAPPAPGVVDSGPEAATILDKIRPWLLQSFDMRVTRSVELQVLPGQDIDSIMGSNPYKGNELGLYQRSRAEAGQAWHHRLFIYQGMGEDKASGVIAHEFTHAWEAEWCPRNQSAVLKEGFAVWVQSEWLDHIGAHVLAERNRSREDPVYGVGYQTIVAWDSRLGVPGLIDTLRKARTVSDGPPP